MESEEKKEQGRYGGNIISSLQYEPPMSDDFRRIYENFAKRTLWIDGNLVPGAFQMNISWYKTTPEISTIFKEHSHPSAEIIGFLGANPDDPYALPADIEIIIDGESHHIRSSSVIFVPPNVPHELRIHEIREPVFHFSVVTDSVYDGSSYS